ncbi:unnamed protein product, partial [Prorocentrum cordatum]
SKFHGHDRKKLADLADTDPVDPVARWRATKSSIARAAADARDARLKAHPLAPKSGHAATSKDATSIVMRGVAKAVRRQDPVPGRRLIQDATLDQTRAQIASAPPGTPSRAMVERKNADVFATSATAARAAVTDGLTEPSAFETHTANAAEVNNDLGQ